MLRVVSKGESEKMSEGGRKEEFLIFRVGQNGHDGYPDWNGKIERGKTSDRMLNNLLLRKGDLEGGRDEVSSYVLTHAMTRTVRR